MGEKSESEDVKAIIDIKKGILHLEGPQEFVEKYLDPVVKNCKPFSKAFNKEKILESEKEEKELGKQTSESFVSLAICLWTVALLFHLNSAPACITYVLVGFGIAAVLFSLYILLPYILHRYFGHKSVLKYIKNNKSLRNIKFFTWSIVLILFGVALVQTGEILLEVLGILSEIIAFIVFFIGLFWTDVIKIKKKVSES